MTTAFSCWRCGETLEGMILPVSRRETCRACEAEIHVCRMCTQYRGGRGVACAEERAEDVSDRERANFCDYFTPSTKAFQPADNPAGDAARERLEALFGAPSETPAPPPEDADRAALEALFAPSPAPDDDAGSS